jgi:hypothetical protein
MKRKLYLILSIIIFFFITACENETRNEKIEKLTSKEYQSVHINGYSKADTKLIVNGSGGLVSIRDDIKNAISLDLKIPFTEIKINPSNENYFRIIGDNSIVNNITYINEKKILKFDFKSIVGEQENPLKLEIFTNQIEYIDNNSGNNIKFLGVNNNINIQNKGILTIHLENVKFKDFLINNLGNINIEGRGSTENLYITDLNIGQYNLKEFKAQNLFIKTRGMSKGILNVSYLAIGDVGFLSEFLITGNTQIKKAVPNINGKLKYEN